MGSPAPGKAEVNMAGWIVRDHFPDGIVPVSKILFDGAGTGTGIGFAASSFTTGIDMASATISGDDIVLSATGVIMAATSVAIEIAGTSKLAVTATGIKLDTTVTLDDDGTIADASNIMTITQNTITLVGSTKINLDGPTDVSGDFTLATSKKITTAAELTLNSVDPMTMQIGGVDWLQMDETAISAFAAADDTVGHAVYFETEDGGVDGGAASTGQAGGLYNFKTGDGSVAVTAGAVGGAGGVLSFTTGVGNTGDAAGHGGVGGAFNITAGAGGDSGAGAGVGGTGGSITLTAGAGGGAGGGVAGAPGKVKLAAGLLHHTDAQSIAMGDNAVVLTLVPGTPTGTLLTSNVLWVDPESGATENLLLPPEGDCNGMVLYIYNFGGESVVVQDDAGGAVDTILTTEIGVCFCNGTAWKGVNIA